MDFWNVICCGCDNSLTKQTSNQIRAVHIMHHNAFTLQNATLQWQQSDRDWEIGTKWTAKSSTRNVNIHAHFWWGEYDTFSVQIRCLIEPSALHTAHAHKLHPICCTATVRSLSLSVHTKYIVITKREISCEQAAKHSHCHCCCCRCCSLKITLPIHFHRVTFFI